MSRILTLLAGLLLLPALLAAPAFAEGAYKVKAGDVLRIEVLEDATLNRSSLIPPDGRITIPLAGSIAAAGRSVEEIQADLIKKLTPSFAAAPNVFVSIESIFTAPIDNSPVVPVLYAIYVNGEAAKPGRVDVEPGTTVLQLFAQMGGFSKFAATKRIQLRRIESGTEKVYGINYDQILAGASTAGNTTLKDGDVIIVPQRRLFE
jgi:polysaccharide biosynthesis/export protein